MIVTDVLEYDKRKVLIQLDGHFTFPLYKGEVRSFHLVKGEEMAKEVYAELFEEVLPKRVKLRAMNLLQKRSYTRAGLRRKLLEGKYPESLVELALDYVTKYRYLDDLRYAQEYIRCYCESRSRTRIAQDLYAKGVGKDLIEQAWIDYERVNAPVDEQSQIMAILSKKHYDRTACDYKEKVKIMNYLYRKGYSADSIRRCMQFEEEYTNL